MTGITSTLPKEVFIEVPENKEDSGMSGPFLLRFLENPTFVAPDIRATRVSSMYSTYGNDVLDYNYDD